MKFTCHIPNGGVLLLPFIIQLSFSGIVHEINHPAIGVLATFVLAAWPHAQQGGAKGARQGASWLQGMLVNPGVNQPRVEFFGRMLSIYDIYIYICVYNNDIYIYIYVRIYDYIYTYIWLHM